MVCLHFTLEDDMKKFTFTVDLVDSDLDTQKVIESLQKDLDTNFTSSFAGTQ